MPPDQIVTNLDDWTEGTFYYDEKGGTLHYKQDGSDDVIESLTVNYQQYYTTAGIETHQENGAVQDQFLITADMSLSSVLSTINNSSVGVTMFLDDATGKISVTRKETGSFHSEGVEMSFSGGFFKETLQLNEANEKGGQNAIFTLNGLETERTSNTFTAGGMTITLKDTFIDSAAPITLSAQTDTDSIFDTIKAFVDEYNEILGYMNSKLTEERFRDFRPLTDEERDAISEKEAERWEEKARSGLLRSDNLLRSGLDRMRLDFYSPVNSALESAFNQLASIGITTSSDYLERGKLVIDEDELRAAIEEDAEGVFNLFAATGDSYEEQGIGRRLRDTLQTTISDIGNRAGGRGGRMLNHQFTIGREVDRINDRISNFERRLEQKEARYWRQFNAMEAAMARANSQYETLFSALGGLQ